MTIDSTPEYLISKQFMASKSDEEIALKFAEMMIKMNEINAELSIVKKQLHRTADQLKETIEFIQSHDGGN